MDELPLRSRLTLRRSDKYTAVTANRYDERVPNDTRSDPLLTVTKLMSLQRLTLGPYLKKVEVGIVRKAAMAVFVGTEFDVFQERGGGGRSKPI